MSLPRVLIIGNGHLGKLLDSALIGFAAITLWTKRMCDIDGYALISLAPDIIINTAGKTDLTFCETDKAACWDSNVVQPLNLYRINARTVRAHYIHISSGCIWDGPYNEDGKPFEFCDSPTPACFYSWSKYAFETMVRREKRATKLSILRPRQVYSDSYSKTVTRNTLQKLMGYQKLIDTPNSMTSAYTIIKTLKHIIEHEVESSFCVYDTGIITPYKVGCMLAEAGLRKMPIKLDKAELDKTLIPRRVDTVLYDPAFEYIVKPPNILDEMARVISLFKYSLITEK